MRFSDEDEVNCFTKFGKKCKDIIENLQTVYNRPERTTKFLVSTDETDENGFRIDNVVTISFANKQELLAGFEGCFPNWKCRQQQKKPSYTMRHSSNLILMKNFNA